MSVEEVDRRLLAETRRERIKDMLEQAGAVTIGELQERFGIAPMTARRDLEELARRGLARRTHGGAVLPSNAVPEDSFAKRLGVATEAKIRLAAAAVRLLSLGETVFLDSSTTAYFVAQQLAQAGTRVRVITNSGPVMHVLSGCEHPQPELIATGGILRRITSSYVGPGAVHAIREHFADSAFVSVTGISSTGVLTDADVLEAEVKRTMIEQTAQPVLLLDGSKLSVHGRQAICPLSALSLVLADGLAPADVERLSASGVTVREVTALGAPIGTHHRGSRFVRASPGGGGTAT